MSDYVTLRVEHIFRYMIGVIRSHIFSPFIKNFCANNPGFRSHDKVTNQTTIYGTRRLPAFPFSLKNANFRSIVSGPAGPGRSSTESHGAEIMPGADREKARKLRQTRRVLFYISGACTRMMNNLCVTRAATGESILFLLAFRAAIVISP